MNPRMTDVVKTASFTPGPWVAQKSSIGGYNIVPANKSNFTICRIANAITYIMDFDGAAEADSHLIAAAPELLAQLESATDFIERTGIMIWNGGSLDKLRAAIAAAKGGAA